MVLSILDENENIDSKAANENHENIHNGSPGHDNTKRAKLILEHLVIEGREAEVSVVLDLI